MTRSVRSLILPVETELDPPDAAEPDDFERGFCDSTQFLLALESAIDITVKDARRTVDEGEEW